MFFRDYYAGEFICKNQEICQSLVDDTGKGFIETSVLLKAELNIIIFENYEDFIPGNPYL
jgi:hypothetical protein